MNFDSLPTRTVPRRQKRSPLAPLLHILITAATLVGAYFIIAPHLGPKPLENKTVVRVTRPRSRPRPSLQPQRTSSPPVAGEHKSHRPVEPPPPPEPTHYLADLPQAVALPAVEDRTITVLAKSTVPVEISLLTNSEVLTFRDSRVVFNGAVVAGVRCNEGRIEFRWVETSSEAVSALRHSLLLVAVGDEQKAVALSAPMGIDAEPIALKNRLARLKYECHDHVPMEHVRFALTAKLPENTATGHNLQAMAAGDEGLITYPFDDETIVDTKVKVWKSGNTINVDIDNRFQLPSGYERPLTIAEGALRLKKLDSLLVELSNAPSGRARFRSAFDEAQDELSYANRLPVRAPGGHGTSSILVGQKSLAIARAERNLARIREDLDYISDLTSNEKMINRDHAATLAIAEFSHLLRDVRLRYRFYVLVGGKPLDLVVAD